MSSATAFVALGSATAGAAGDLYGSLAISFGSGSAVVGAGANYSSYEKSDQRAMLECGRRDCRVVVRFVNGCGAIAVRDGSYKWAWGNSRIEAEQGALVALGPDPSPLLTALGSAATGSAAPGSAALGSAAPSRAQILTSECTANAR
ncbi:DUF4189 domain-containing protein [Nocardia sp. NPDC051463]|uniref:DUF4189 domain-containing protein n=1 Tax=Nocardia sp. NPDC051463 TaxID=3154845 RepID=UPI00343B5F28